MPTETKSATPVSIYSIARELGYTPAAIHKAIDRYGYEPETVTPGGVRYFSRLIIQLLRDKMRKSPNGNGKNGHRK
jgi:hypothetical protein